ncbi:MAG: hypothetical protein JXM73_14025, partial [Anaerolineae bacterium]|nr:hypothetical protein [Anaerolineae bacterium]
MKSTSTSIQGIASIVATNTLWQQAGLVAPRNGVANLVFFQVRGNCLAPDIQDGDVLFAIWRPMPICQARLDGDELAVFLVQDAGTGSVSVLLKRWCGMLVGDNGSHEATVRLAGEGVVHAFPVSQVHLVANHVRLVQRGGLYNPDLLAGVIHAGLDLWFPDDVKRILASTHETMAASMRAAPPLNPQTAEAYQQGFIDALRAVAVAFGVAAPAQPPRPTAMSRTI